jgi:hypothetical protein
MSARTQVFPSREGIRRFGELDPEVSAWLEATVKNGAWCVFRSLQQEIDTALKCRVFLRNQSREGRFSRGAERCSAAWNAPGS